MEGENEPLLSSGSSELRYRPPGLSYAEVVAASRSKPWRRARITVVFGFWLLLAAALSLVVGLIFSAPKCAPAVSPTPLPPPVYLTLSPLVAH